MPIEKRKDETRDEFISRCIKVEIDSDKSQDQAVAICINYADQYFKSATTSSVSDATWSSTPAISINLDLAKVKKILIDENLPDETILDMKSRGFKVYIKSARKIRRSDRKAYNRLKTLGLNFDSDYLSGDEKQLDRQKDFSLYMSSDDPILDTLLMKSEKYHYRQVLHTEPVFSIEDAENKEKAFLENHKLKFATIRILYEYKVRPDVPEAISGSRPFCDKLFRKGGEYTLEQIKNLPSGHLKDMGLEADVFLYRGGFYTLPGTNQTTPYCRHEWRMKAVLI